MRALPYTLTSQIGSMLARHDRVRERRPPSLAALRSSDPGILSPAALLGSLALLAPSPGSFKAAAGPLGSAGVCNRPGPRPPATLTQTDRDWCRRRGLGIPTSRHREARVTLIEADRMGGDAQHRLRAQARPLASSLRPALAARIAPRTPPSVSASRDGAAVDPHWVSWQALACNASRLGGLRERLEAMAQPDGHSASVERYEGLAGGGGWSAAGHARLLRPLDRGVGPRPTAASGGLDNPARFVAGPPAPADLALDSRIEAVAGRSTSRDPLAETLRQARLRARILLWGAARSAVELAQALAQLAGRVTLLQTGRIACPPGARTPRCLPWCAC